MMCSDPDHKLHLKYKLYVNNYVPIFEFICLQYVVRASYLNTQFLSQVLDEGKYHLSMLHVPLGFPDAQLE